jgi:hypothetical protein
MVTSEKDHTVGRLTLQSRILIWRNLGVEREDRVMLRKSLSRLIRMCPVYVMHRGHTITDSSPTWGITVIPSSLHGFLVILLALLALIPVAHLHRLFRDIALMLRRRSKVHVWQSKRRCLSTPRRAPGFRARGKSGGSGIRWWSQSSCETDPGLRGRCCGTSSRRRDCICVGHLELTRYESLVIST